VMLTVADLYNFHSSFAFAPESTDNPTASGVGS
jgi:hypothetical protein